MVPVEDDGAVRLALHDVAGEFVVEAWPEERRDATDGGQPVDEDVVEDVVVEGEQVVELRLAHAVLRAGQVGERVSHERGAVVPLDALEQRVEDAGHAVLREGGREGGVI